MKRVLLIGLPLLLVGALAGVALVTSTSGRTDAEPAPTYTYSRDPAVASAFNAIDERANAKQRAQDAIGAAMARQSAALLAGDQNAFTSLADSSASRAVAWLKERFTSLRALGVAQWSTNIVSYTSWSQQRSQANVKVEYCFAAGCSRPLVATLHTMWEMSDPANPKLTEVYESSRGTAPPPWAQSVLQAKTGSRVVVAATPANAGKLDSVLAAAEAAAPLADGFAAAAKPGKYVIYLAGDKEWGKWPYGDEGKWVAAYADERTESVVVNMAGLRGMKPEVLLRHEMTHVASLAGRTAEVKRADSWWLNEGLAEYAGANGAPFSSYYRRAETAAFVRSRWNGDLRIGEPTAKTSLRDASARYGTAFLAVSCLMTTYGQTKTLGFFHAVAVQGNTLPAAASSQLGTPWPTVTKTCAPHIRRTA